MSFIILFAILLQPDPARPADPATVAVLAFNPQSSISCCEQLTAHPDISLAIVCFSLGTGKHSPRLGCCHFSACRATLTTWSTTTPSVLFQTASQSARILQRTHWPDDLSDRDCRRHFQKYIASAASARRHASVSDVMTPARTPHRHPCLREAERTAVERCLQHCTLMPAACACALSRRSTSTREWYVHLH